MTKTLNKFQEYWDNLLSEKLPPFAHFGKVKDELTEHFFLLRIMWKRFLLPLVVFYLIMSYIFDVYILGSLFLSLLIFVYSNFLPDLDIFVKKPDGTERESLWYEKYFLLLFSPIFVYYVFTGEAHPIYSSEHRPFHNIKSIIIWGLFLYFIGSIFWPDVELKRIMFSVFGIAGFVFHLMVDGIIKIFNFGKILIEDSTTEEK